MHDPLVRRDLPDGYIDLAIGEARVVREALFSYASSKAIFEFGQGDPCTWEYQHPRGYAPLVRLLEDRHQVPIVVTCGAKQGLSAVFYALRKRGVTNVGLEVPFWSQLPSAIRLSGLDVVTGRAFDPKYGSFLHVAPNNPDGHLMTLEENRKLYETYRDRKVPFVHDAAYYSDIYVPESYELGAFGDVRIFSVSKMYGLSGLRLGYVACDDTSFYSDIMEYVETTTVGASAPAQQLFSEILETERENPSFRASFKSNVKACLTQAREIMRHVHPDVLVIPKNEQLGMFGWYEKGPKFDPVTAKVVVADGAAFGDLTKVRLNLAVKEETLKTAIQRLHNVANVAYLCP